MRVIKFYYYLLGVHLVFNYFAFVALMDGLMLLSFICSFIHVSEA